MRRHHTMLTLLLLLTALNACSHSVTRPIVPGISFCALLPDGETVTFTTTRGSVTADLGEMERHPCGTAVLRVYRANSFLARPDPDTLAFADILGFTTEGTLMVETYSGTRYSADGMAWQIENNGGIAGDVTINMRITDPKTDIVGAQTQRIPAAEIRRIEIGLKEDQGSAGLGILLGIGLLVAVVLNLDNIRLM